jgi:DNA polymerase III epsilon subunit family exonuclease
MLDADFAVVDLETTGFAADGADRIVEIAVLRCRPNAGLIHRFVTLVNPQRAVAATSVHGLRPADLAAAPPFQAIAAEVERRLAGAVLVAHNCRFDVGFLQAELTRARRPALAGPTLCTIALMARLGMPAAGRSLRSCCEAFAVPYDPSAAHGAERDARAAARVLLCLLREARDQGLSTLEDLGCMRAAAPPNRAMTRAAPRPAAAPATRVALAARRLGDVWAIGDPDVAAYLDLVDRVLADRLLTADEADALRATARRCGLSDRATTSAHAQYVARLNELAWADGELTGDEAADLARVAELLGTDQEAAWSS